MSAETRPRVARFPGWVTLGLVLVAYLVVLSSATYPALALFRTHLPSLCDPLHHLWVMKWYSSCLLEGRSPVLCPALEYPIGVSLGQFATLHLQSLVYLVASRSLDQEAARYNLVWVAGFLSTGLGTFVLIWDVLRHRVCAAFGGMLAMLSAPMMGHALGHLDLLYVGGVALFLVAWLRFVDRPGWGRLAAAVALYSLVAMSASYYMVMSTVPATLYLAWCGWREGRGRRVAWLRTRVGWFLGFAALTVLALAVVLWPQVRLMGQGALSSRAWAEFNFFRVPLWCYVTPTTRHRLGRLLQLGLGANGIGIERDSYLGVVTLALLAYAAVRRVAFARASFWWAAFAVMVVLSLGTEAWVGSFRLPLPAGWLWRTVCVFRLIRVPARFNMFASLCAAVIAAAGLRHLLERLPHQGPRMGLATGLALGAFADLAPVPFGAGAPLPIAPAAYEYVRRADPHAAILEAPMFLSAQSQDLSSLCSYWQSFHRLKTSAGYTGFPNLDFDGPIVGNSPFAASAMLEPSYLTSPSSMDLGASAGVDFRAYVWLFLTQHRYDYLIFHHSLPADPTLEGAVARAEELLAGAKVFEDGATAVFARSRLAPPSRRVWLCTEGWLDRDRRAGDLAHAARRTARVVVYQTRPDEPLVFTLRGAALRTPRSVRVRSGGRELARWTVAPGPAQTFVTPSFQLPAGRHELTIESDREERPNHHRDAISLRMIPYSLCVQGVSFQPAARALQAQRENAVRPR